MESSVPPSFPAMAIACRSGSRAPGGQGQGRNGPAGKRDLCGGRAVGKADGDPAQLIAEGQGRFAAVLRQGQQVQPGFPLRHQRIQQGLNAGHGFPDSRLRPGCVYGQRGFAAAGIGERAAGADADDPVTLYNDFRAAGVLIPGIGVGIEAQCG